MTAVLAAEQWFNTPASPLIRVLIALVGIFVVLPAYFSPKTGLLAEDGPKPVRSLLVGVATFGLSVPAVWLWRRIDNVVRHRLFGPSIATWKKNRRAVATAIERQRRYNALGITARGSAWSVQTPRTRRPLNQV